jgi:hypothetical protein
MKFISYKYWLNEKFSDESDPIEDLGIGIRGRLRQEKNILDEKEEYEKAEYLFKDERLLVAAHVTHIIIKDFLQKKHPEITEKTVNEMLEKYRNAEHLSEFGCKIIREYFQDKFYVKFEINEKFTDESDPIADMGIGNKFVRLKPGDVLAIKKPIKSYYRQFCFSKCDKYSAHIIPIGVAGVVNNTPKINNENILHIDLVLFPSINYAINQISSIISRDTVYYHTCGTAHIEKWEEYFDVIKLK